MNGMSGEKKEEGLMQQEQKGLILHSFVDRPRFNIQFTLSKPLWSPCPLMNTLYALSVPSSWNALDCEHHSSLTLSDSL